MTTDQDDYIFISYARADGLAEAARIERSLAERGFHTWRDQRSLSPYQDCCGEIETAIERSRQVLVCLTKSVSIRKDSVVRREISLTSMVLITKMDQDIELQTQHLDALRGVSARHRIGVETMTLKRLIDKRSQMFDMLRQIIDEPTETAKGIIDSMGR